MIHKNAEGLPLYLFDRSRLECASDCLRKRYWLYDFLGVGIVRLKELAPYWPFITGGFVHEGVELILKGANGKEAAISAAASYAKEWEPVINSNDLAPERQAILQMELAQEIDLTKALIYGWSLVGYPRLLEHYALVEGGIEQEEEISWLVGDAGEEVEMRLLTRTDVLAKSKASGMAMLINLKTVGDPSERWRLSFTRDMQTLTEAIAVEARLGMKVDGIIIEGLVKGKNSEYPKGSGFWQSSSMLIYAWVKDSTDISLPGEQGGAIYATSWDWTCTGPHTFGNNQRCPGGKNHTLGKGFRKRPVRDCFNGGVLGWIDYLVRNDPACLESYFLQLPPINRSEFEVERWKRQHLVAEKHRQDDAAEVDNWFLGGNKDKAFELLDYKFPMHTGYECIKCAYHDICWAGADPFDENLWKPRTPNHLLEAEMLVRESVTDGRTTESGVASALHCTD